MKNWIPFDEELDPDEPGDEMDQLNLDDKQ
jgi:hypothetical protein